MTEHDVRVGFRLRLFTLADELGNVSAACRAMGVDRSTYYRLKAKVDRWGLEALNVRERRRPRMPNQIGPHLEQRIIACALGHPGDGPRRISAELARQKWGAMRIGEHGVWRVLVRVGLHTRAKRLALIARHRDPYERRPDPPPPTRHIDATEPGQKVQLDCFSVGRLSGTTGTVWQYTAIDVASAFTWAELHSSERNPRARHTRKLLHRVAHELAQAGWRLRAGHHRQRLGVPGQGLRCRRRPARRPPAAHPRRTPQRPPAAHPRRTPQQHGCVERVQLTILEECWRPAFARSLVPKMTALAQDLDDYLVDYNYDRAHTGRLTQGRVPADLVFGARKTTPGR